MSRHVPRHTFGCHCTPIVAHTLCGGTVARHGTARPPPPPWLGKLHNPFPKARRSNVEC